MGQRLSWPPPRGKPPIAFLNFFLNHLECSSNYCKTEEASWIRVYVAIKNPKRVQFSSFRSLMDILKRNNSFYFTSYVGVLLLLHCSAALFQRSPLSFMPCNGQRHLKTFAEWPWQGDMAKSVVISCGKMFQASCPGWWFIQSGRRGGLFKANKPLSQRHFERRLFKLASWISPSCPWNPCHWEIIQV